MAAPPQPPTFPSAAGVARAISSMQDTLLDAAFKGDLPLLKRVVWVLDNGMGCPREAVEAARTDGGFSALQLAAANEQLEVCRYLAGVLRVDVDAADDKGRTPLVYAVMSEKIAIVKCLLDHGADPDKADEAGLTPLHSAAGIGDCEIIELLLAKGAYVDPIAEEIGTPLHLATKEQQVGAMKTLLKHNAYDEDATMGKIAKLKSSPIKAIENKDYFSATMWYTKVIEHDPNDATLFSNRSLCLLRMGDGQRALLDALDCRGMRPDWPKACYRQGAALMSLKDYKNACQALLDGLKLDPENAEEMGCALREAMESLKISKGDTKAT
ncbi:ankyrin repeat and protein kinase domain-containing protein 1-like [Hordeum vulgare subsp. vulgare]|uniref:Uncharacterized protein n=1 Tax=Hordeum vulgare subsp. vulgare TaxID=112509 RepID=A0A8I7B565_HORVV|nr:ankyrin repeat and protein kinase domain-containing protein 1-like [Hordeum vulgare subsp. vulgare]